MTTSQPTPAGAATSWQVRHDVPEDALIPALRRRLVALVAALVIQATVALVQFMPNVPGRGSTDFWGKFAVLEFLAAAILSAGFGPRVSVRDLPAIGRIVLGIGFVVVPAVALALGGIDAARVAHIDGTTATVASWTGTAFVGIAFFGLPLLALAAPTHRAPIGGSAA